MKGEIEHGFDFNLVRAILPGLEGPRAVPFRNILLLKCTHDELHASRWQSSPLHSTHRHDNRHFGVPRRQIIEPITVLHHGKEDMGHHLNLLSIFSIASLFSLQMPSLVYMTKQLLPEIAPFTVSHPIRGVDGETTKSPIEEIIPSSFDPLISCTPPLSVFSP